MASTQNNVPIKVYVRSRNRSPKEISSNANTIIKTPSNKSLIITNPNGYNGVSTKTYEFEHVFSPISDQKDIFEKLVLEVLAEVRSGCNCTVFAYGQTGTGKTYTMMGDLDVRMGRIGVDAGIIPRVLDSIFRKEKNDANDNNDDHHMGDNINVKVSFVELYNEELRDLLSVDDSKKVKIYDNNSSNHKSINVQGLEEFSITDSITGLELLTKGNEKRQVAATNSNDYSSRSHTIFTITIHNLQNNKISKLNLVDLAGSENISKSLKSVNHEQKRAREAGLINQSLLTLGRVINALVEKQPHIPYRESNLTRLLRDSLGGGTRTRMIATISPADICFDETISTLEYATRAKSVQNKNQSLNSNTNNNVPQLHLLQQIDTLKKELRESRLKDGVHLTQEKYNEIITEGEMAKLRVTELTGRVELLEKREVQQRAEWEECMQGWIKTKDELNLANTQLSEKTEKLKIQKNQLNESLQGLNFEKEISNILETKNFTLSTISNNLISKILNTISDLKNLSEQINKNLTIDSNNDQQVLKLKKLINGNVKILINCFKSFKIQLFKSCEDLTDSIETYGKSQEDIFGDGIQKYDEKGLLFSTQFDQLKSILDTNLSQALGLINDSTKISDELENDVSGQISEGKGYISNSSNELMNTITEIKENLSLKLSEISTSVSTEFSQLKDKIQQQNSDINELCGELAIANNRYRELCLSNSKELSNVKLQNSERLKKAKCDMLLQFDTIMESILHEKSDLLNDDIDLISNEIEKDSNENGKKFTMINNSVESLKTKQQNIINECSNKNEEIIKNINSCKDNYTKKLLKINENNNISINKIDEYFNSLSLNINNKLKLLSEIIKKLELITETNLKNESTTEINSIGLNLSTHFIELKQDFNSLQETVKTYKTNALGQVDGINHLSNEFIQMVKPQINTLKTQGLEELKGIKKCSLNPEIKTIMEKTYEVDNDIPELKTRDELRDQLKLQINSDIKENEKHDDNVCLQDKNEEIQPELELIGDASQKTPTPEPIAEIKSRKRVPLSDLDTNNLDSHFSVPPSKRRRALSTIISGEENMITKEKIIKDTQDKITGSVRRKKGRSYMRPQTRMRRI